MSIEQLHRLADRAEDVTGRSVDRLSEVHERIRAVRRRRTAGAVLGAGMLVLAVLGGTYVVRTGLDDPAVEPAGPPADIRNGALVSHSLDGGDVVVADGGLAHLPTDAMPFTSLQFTADGRELVYLARGQEVTALDVFTGSTRLLATCPDRCMPSLSPDGRTVAAEGEDGLVLQEVGGDARPLGVSGSAPTWSPDGERIAYVDRRGLMVVERDGSQPRRLATYDAGTVNAPSWSPDGSHLVFVLPEESGPGFGRDLPMLDHTLATVGLDGEEPVRLAALGSCVCLGVAAPTATWSPDGELLAYTRVDAGPPREPGAATSAGLYVMRPDGTGEERLTSGVEGELAWQPVREE